MPKGAVERGKESEQKTITREFLNAYERLAKGAAKSQGFDGARVAKVAVDAIQDDMKSRGFIDPSEAAQRKSFLIAKLHWIGRANLTVEADGLIWRK
jgi:ribosomal protein S20